MVFTLYPPSLFLFSGTLCSNNPCKNGGTCVLTTNGYSCQCAAKYSGEHCESRKAICVFNEVLSCNPPEKLLTECWNSFQPIWRNERACHGVSFRSAADASLKERRLSYTGIFNILAIVHDHLFMTKLEKKMFTCGAFWMSLFEFSCSSLENSSRNEQFNLKTVGIRN